MLQLAFCVYMGCVCVLCKHLIYISNEASQVVLVLKNPAANAGDLVSTAGPGRSPRGKHTNIKQHSK